MAEVRKSTDQQALALEAAQLTADILNRSIEAMGQANWLLSGGTAPLGAYTVLARDYAHTVDWSKVVVAIGDERCVPLDHPDANWPIISQSFLDVVGVPAAQQLRPESDKAPELAAKSYTQKLQTLASDNGIPHFDLVWLGMGEDGHTLSLFPDHPALDNTQSIVTAVHDAPKLPPDRMSLTLKALEDTSNCLIMVSGAGKAPIIKQVFDGDRALPISQAVRAIETAGGYVIWLLDAAAASLV
jgi:6-phosphogluconolactonase